jgi:pyruvate formate lyase activating enzyme
VTLSGGECLAQADFCEALLKALKAEGIHTAVDTSGLTTRAVLERVTPYTGVFLYDIKAIDEEEHKKCTGVSNRAILDNLLYLDKMGAKTEIRIPLVPNYNEKEIERIADFLRPLKHVSAVRVLPYHSYAASKYEALGMKNTLPDRVPTEEELLKAKAFFDFLPIK